MSQGESTPQTPRVVIERRYRATLHELWELWTTSKGMEAWWGPDGFTVTVRNLDLRPGGQLVYAMTATAAPQIAFMENAGMPLTTETRLTYVDVQPPTRLEFEVQADFIPGVAPYPVRTLVELEAQGEFVRLVLTTDRMHDEQWTHMATMGRESELDKLAALLDR